MSINRDYDQKGFSQIFILIILVLGLIVTYYVVNYTQTNFKPKAYEDNVIESREEVSPENKPVAGGGCGFVANCEDGQAVIYSSLPDGKGGVFANGCHPFDRQPINKSCIQYFCDDKIYPQSDGALIHKYATSLNEVGWCNYTYVPVPQFTINTSNPDKSIDLTDQCKPEVYCDPSNVFIHKYVKTENPFNADGSCKFEFENTNVDCVYRAEPRYFTKTDKDKAMLLIKYGIVQIPQNNQIRSGAEPYESLLCNPGDSEAGFPECGVCNSRGWYDSGSADDRARGNNQCNDIRFSNWIEKLR